MDLAVFTRKAIGVPFVPHGRDYDGWDCWGLVVRAYADVLGAALPDYQYESIADYRRLARLFTDRSQAHWRPSPAVPMAVAAIYRRGRVIHAGLVITPRRIMHVEDGINTVCEPIERFRIEAYYVPADRGAPPV